MNKVVTIIKKELAFYFNNPVGYIVAVLFAVFANFLFIKDIFLRGNTSMRPFFEMTPWLLIIFIPAVAMRMLSEEKRSHTLEVLLSLPITEFQIILGKLLALIVFIFISFILTLSIPISLFYLGDPDLSEMLVSYSGIGFFVFFATSLSLFFSSLTTNQVGAFLSSVLSLFLLLVIGGDFAAPFLPQIIRENLTVLTPSYHYSSFLKGVVDMRSVFYFVSCTVVFTYLTVIMLEKRD